MNDFSMHSPAHFRSPPMLRCLPAAICCRLPLNDYLQPVWICLSIFLIIGFGAHVAVLDVLEGRSVWVGVGVSYSLLTLYAISVPLVEWLKTYNFGGEAKILGVLSSSMFVGGLFFVWWYIYGMEFGTAYVLLLTTAFWMPVLLLTFASLYRLRDDDWVVSDAVVWARVISLSIVILYFFTLGLTTDYKNEASLGLLAVVTVSILGSAMVYAKSTSRLLLRLVFLFVTCAVFVATILISSARDDVFLGFSIVVWFFELVLLYYVYLLYQTHAYAVSQAAVSIVPLERRIYSRNIFPVYLYTVGQAGAHSKLREDNMPLALFFASIFIPAAWGLVAVFFMQSTTFGVSSVCLSVICAWILGLDKRFLAADHLAALGRAINDLKPGSLDYSAHVNDCKWKALVAQGLKHVVVPAERMRRDSITAGDFLSKNDGGVEYGAEADQQRSDRVAVYDPVLWRKLKVVDQLDWRKMSMRCNSLRHSLPPVNYFLCWSRPSDFPWEGKMYQRREGLHLYDQYHRRKDQLYQANQKYTLMLQIEIINTVELLRFERALRIYHMLVLQKRDNFNVAQLRAMKPDNFTLRQLEMDLVEFEHKQKRNDIIRARQLEERAKAEKLREELVSHHGADWKDRQRAIAMDLQRAKEEAQSAAARNRQKIADDNQHLLASQRDQALARLGESIAEARAARQRTKAAEVSKLQRELDKLTRRAAALRQQYEVEDTRLRAAVKQREDELKRLIAAHTKAGELFQSVVQENTTQFDEQKISKEQFEERQKDAYNKEMERRKAAKEERSTFLAQEKQLRSQDLERRRMRLLEEEKVEELQRQIEQKITELLTTSDISSMEQRKRREEAKWDRRDREKHETWQREEQTTMERMMKRAEDHHQCTFTVTSGKVVLQPWYRCKTCGPSSLKGGCVCFMCSMQCHKGHQLEEEAEPSYTYCDCGKNGCKLTLPVEVQRAMTRFQQPQLRLTDQDREAIHESENPAKMIRDKCVEQKIRWTDADFPPGPESLFLDPTRPHKELWTKIKWVRFRDTVRSGQVPEVFVPPIDPDDIKQGKIGNCWFMSALSVLSQRQSDLKACFLTTEYNDQGVYGFCLYKNGVPQRVVVDDWMPVLDDPENPGSYKLLFASSYQPHEMWPCLIEKAYAKLYHSYQAIEGGWVDTALVDLTGGMSDRYMWSNVTTQRAISDGSLWNRLLRFKQAGFLLGCGTPPGKLGGDEDVNEFGIVQSHAYSVLDVAVVDGFQLIQVRNPWGREEWKGDWSDNSPLWTRRRKAKVDYRDADDGRFWMAWHDFVIHFAELYVCRFFDDERWPFRGEISSAWDPTLTVSTAGGCTKYKSVVNNPQWLLIPQEENSNVVISLMQEESRGLKDAVSGNFPLIILEVYDNDGERVSSDDPGIMIINKGASTREIHVQFKVESRKPLTILPCTFDAGVSARFQIRWYATKSMVVEFMKPE